ncbi:MAG TPA: type II toxin-antitoxin system RelE/ParE family toxin [Blastocatellia bacterium]|nr:type II toxin-antitoxin system RelE/ParE family toxin [Blastocatellia bacterium]
MSKYIVSPEANEDIFEIWRYMAVQADVETAERVTNDIYPAFASLVRMPGQGHTRSDLTSHSVLFFNVYSYLIVYRPKSPLEIVAVLHGKRDVKQLLRERSV